MFCPFYIPSSEKFQIPVGFCLLIVQGLRRAGGPGGEGAGGAIDKDLLIME